MQSKLVEGIGDKRNKGADSIVPQKHTPLELQVVELKKKYPDILLIIEVQSALPHAMACCNLSSGMTRYIAVTHQEL